MVKLMIVISALLVVFASIFLLSLCFFKFKHYFYFLVQSEAKQIPLDVKLEDFDDTIKANAPRLIALADLFRSQVNHLEKEIAANSDKLPFLSTLDFDAYRERMNERKKKLNNFIDTFKPKFEKNVDLTVELLKNGKTSDKAFNDGLVKAASSVKSIGDGLAELMNAVKAAAKTN